MANYSEQDLYCDLGTEKVNWEVMFDTNEDRGPIITVRARPYRTDRNNGRMVLAGGRTLLEAFSYAQVGLMNAKYIPLDWSRRASGVGVMEGVEASDIRRARRGTPEEVYEAMKNHYGAANTGYGPNGPQGPLESDTEDARRTPRTPKPSN